MAENEKTPEQVEKAETKPAKAPKPAKPPLRERIGAWYRSLKAECKKISWASAKVVKQNTILVVVCVLIVGVVIGLLDYGFSQTIVGLSRII